MKPGFIDFIAAIASAGLCVLIFSYSGNAYKYFSELIAKNMQNQNDNTCNPYNSPFNPYQSQQFNRPRPQPPQAQRPAPPQPPLPQPYGMEDCKKDVRLGSDNPQQSYVDAYCACFAPQRARLGPRDLSEQQELDIGKTIDQELMPQCERQALTPVMNSKSLESEFLRGFKPLCNDKPFIFYGEKADLGKTDELCDCLAKSVLEDMPSMAAFIAGAGRVSNRPYVQERRNACVRKVFPPPASAGWQISSRADGKKFAYVDAKKHKLISRIEMSCSDAGQPKLIVTWRQKPSKEQIYFGGGDVQDDIVISLKNGQVEGASAKKFYDQILFWQEISKKDYFDLDTTDFSVGVFGDEIGDGYGITLGDTKVRIGSLIEDCKPTKKPTTAMPERKSTATPQTNSAPGIRNLERKNSCTKKSIKAIEEFDQANENLQRAPTVFNGVQTCNFFKIKFQKAEAMIKILRECNDIVSTDDIQSSTRQMIQRTYPRYKSECVD